MRTTTSRKLPTRKAAHEMRSTASDSSVGHACVFTFCDTPHDRGQAARRTMRHGIATIKQRMYVCTQHPTTPLPQNSALRSSIRTAAYPVRDMHYICYWRDAGRSDPSESTRGNDQETIPGQPPWTHVPPRAQSEDIAVHVLEAENENRLVELMT